MCAARSAGWEADRDCQLSPAAGRRRGRGGPNCRPGQRLCRPLHPRHGLLLRFTRRLASWLAACAQSGRRAPRASALDASHLVDGHGGTARREIAPLPRTPLRVSRCRACAPLLGAPAGARLMNERVSARNYRADTAASPRIAVIGLGYWGRNLVRNVAGLGALAGLCDSAAEALSAHAALHPDVLATADA